MGSYDFEYGTSIPMEKQIEDVIDICNKLDAEEKVTLFNFGKYSDLVLHVYKDSDYNREVDKDAYNLVTIHTAQDGKWVDDVEDTHVTDGSLYKELERIYNYRDFSTL